MLLGVALNDGIYIMSKQSFCWHCGGKLKLPYFAEITDPIGNTHKIHKVCIDGAKNSFRAMPYEIKHTCNGIDVIQLMDHVV